MSATRYRFSTSRYQSPYLQCDTELLGFLSLEFGVSEFLQKQTNTMTKPPKSMTKSRETVI